MDNYFILIWGGVFVAALVFEFITPLNLVTIWFAFGALGALLAALFEVGFMAQLILFIALSLTAFVMIRPFASKFLRGEIIATNLDRMVGTTFSLAEDLAAKSVCQQKVESQIWTIKNADNTALSKGTLVEVLSIDGVKLIVRKIQ